MKLFGPPKRKVPTPATAGPNRADNPLFQPPAPAISSRTRRMVVIWTSIMLVLTGGVLVVIGPWWQIESVTVSGVRQIDPKSVEAVMQIYLHQRRLGLIPNSNLALVSTGHAEAYVRSRIESRLKIESVTVSKLWPNGLHLTITERTPVAYIQDGERLGVLDRTGTIIEFPQTRVDPSLPVVTESLLVSVGQAVFEPSVVNSLTDLVGLLRDAQIEISSYVLPVIHCPELPPEPATNQNTNQAVEAPLDNSNQNQNTNQAPDGNLNIRRTLIQPACEDATLVKTRPEIHAQMVDGPKLLFDRFQPLAAAVERARRILGEQRPASYIDVRFGDRVFVQ